MEITSLARLRKELRSMPQDELAELCIRLARYNKDNKELIHYLLFEAQDEAGFVVKAKNMVTEAIAATNLSSGHLAKKSIRRGLRLTDRYIKLSGHQDTTLELLVHFCECFRDVGKVLLRAKVLHSLYHRVLVRIDKAHAALHEDLQFDYAERIAELKKFGSSVSSFGRSH